MPAAKSILKYSLPLQEVFCFICIFCGIKKIIQFLKQLSAHYLFPLTAGQSCWCYCRGSWFELLLRIDQPSNFQCWEFIQVWKAVQRNTLSHPRIQHFLTFQFCQSSQEPGDGTWLACCMRLPAQLGHGPRCRVTVLYAASRSSMQHHGPRCCPLRPLEQDTLTGRGWKGKCLANFIDYEIWKSNLFFWSCPTFLCIMRWLFICCNFFFI